MSLNRTFLYVVMSGALATAACGKKDDAAKAAGPTVSLKGAGAATVNLTGQGTIDAAVMKFKVYKFAVSTSAACTTPITVFTSTDGVEKDMLAGPTFGSGTLAAGTYPCVMIELSKVIVDAPATSSKGCVANQTQNDVICQDGQVATLIDGTSVTCSGGAANDQHVALSITTISAGTSGSKALQAPSSATDTTAGLKLNDAFVVGTTDTSGTLTVAFKNFFSAGTSECGSNAPSFSFK